MFEQSSRRRRHMPALQHLRRSTKRCRGAQTCYKAFGCERRVRRLPATLKTVPIKHTLFVIMNKIICRIAIALLAIWASNAVIAQIKIGEPEKTSCRSCKGSGKCRVCKGSGSIPCKRCGGSGDDSLGGYCKDCKRKGKTGCFWCNSTGTCPNCLGTGKE
jgi:hypothetical protein